MSEELWRRIRENAFIAVGVLCFIGAGLVMNIFYNDYSSVGSASSSDKQHVSRNKPSVPPNDDVTESPAAGTKTVHAGSFASPVSLSRVDGAPRGRSPADVTDAVEYVAELKTDLEQKPDMWFLYITGSVRRQGVYKLPANSRLFDLVSAAGGLDGFADAAAVNMAEILHDGIHVHVPRRGEKKSAKTHINTADVHIIASPYGGSYESPNLRQQDTSHKSGNVRRSGKVKTAHSRRGVVNINTADIEGLMILKGIGPVVAKEIIAYRNANGPFKSVDELINVKGIGAAKLRGFREQASVQ